MNTKVKYPCHQCGTICETKMGRMKSSKNKFCSRYCSSYYYSQHRTTGTNRSKLEVWIERQLTNLYPTLTIDYNNQTAINGELDIYIPSLNVAVELNGIFHYEPIFGVDKLAKTQSNDLNKSKSCYDAKIDLCIIDTTHQKYFKEHTSQRYLNIICEIIDDRLLN